MYIFIMIMYMFYKIYKGWNKVGCQFWQCLPYAPQHLPHDKYCRHWWGAKTGAGISRELEERARIPFSAFWLRSSVVSVLISLISDTRFIEPPDISPNFLGCGSICQLAVRAHECHLGSPHGDPNNLKSHIPTQTMISYNVRLILTVFVTDVVILSLCCEIAFVVFNLNLVLPWY